ncbi:transcriptional regulator PAI 2-type [Xylaria palmicola]|nr:transcriptional regulator PAI 2-type [Xylaria palmicola]
MFLRDVHAETSTRVLRQLVRDNPLGVLTTAIRSPSAPLLLVSHIPFLLDVQDEESEEERGVLRGHIARQNPQSKVLIEAAKASPTPDVLEEEVLVLFTASAHHYITPGFYTETKPATGKVAPTWNYAAVQAYGRAKIYWDHKSDEAVAFLSKQTSELSAHAESSIMGYTGTDDRKEPWKVSDAPKRYVELLQKAIIGIEIQIDRLEGKFKMSQEMSVNDRQGVINGLVALDTETGHTVSEMVKERSHLKEARS